MIRAAVLALLLCTPALAETPLDRTDAFEHSFADSYYTFDACGDGLAGRIYRRALQERFAACPFTPAARTRYGARLRAQAAKSRQAIEDMIEQRGGLPVQLEGTNATCHAQEADEGYRKLRSQLLAYSAGSLPATAVLPSTCDADAIGPGMAP
ncbi:MAG: hypothetical protein ACRYHQ_35095 [Janthinobacterium lividum]